MNRRASGLREAWKRTLREDGARLIFLVLELNGGRDSRTRFAEHWKRLTPGLKGIEWKPPTWPNVFPSFMATGQGEPDSRTLAELTESIREHLVRFMDTWFAAGRDYAKWIEQNPELAGILDKSSEHVRVLIQPQPDGSPYPVTTVVSPVEERTLHAAAAQFTDYLRNPLREVLAGPCKRCARYFFNQKGYEQMVYCSRNCRWGAHKTQSRELTQQGMETTALTAMRKLFNAPAAPGKPNSEPWKYEVISVVNKKHGAHCKPKWLTRTINNSRGKHHRQFIRLRDAIERRLATGESVN